MAEDFEYQLNNRGFDKNSSARGGSRVTDEERGELLDFESEQSGISGLSLFWALFFLFCAVFVAVPKIYLANNIYYLSRDIYRLENQKGLLLEERRKLEGELKYIETKHLLDGLEIR